MRPKDLESLKEWLQRRRRLILDASRRTAADIEALRAAERDPEMEEGSQSEQEQNKLSQLGEVEQREIAQIDAALARLDAGRYGVCADCGDEIEERRLQALPFALACTDCARRRERSQVVERSGRSGSGS
jgi:DnaK suppressor protein